MSFTVESKLASGKGGPIRKPQISRGGSGSSLFGGSGLNIGGGVYTPQEEMDSKKRRRGALAAAILLHALILMISFPTLRKEPKQISSNRAVYVVEQVRFEPPAPRKQQKQEAPKKKKAKRIPIPDPTPDAPEPIIDEELEIEIPELDTDVIGDLFEIPDAPGGTGTARGGAPGPMWIQGDVTPPEKLHSPQPRYTEEARKARVQGVVILQAIVDALGNVTSVEVVKGLPEGLEESAVQTVMQWKYKPALHNGEPVPVYMNLTITFSLQ